MSAPWWRAIAADWVKLRKTWITFLVFLGPFGVILVNTLRFTLGYKWLIQQPDKWGAVMNSVNVVLIPTLVLGIAVLASMMNSIEYQGHMWKQFLVLPVPRYVLYLSKFFWLIAFLAVSATLAVVGTWLLGLGLGLPRQIPWALILKDGFYPYLASYGIIAFQLLLSTLFNSQVYALIAGVVGFIASTTTLLPKWVPWVYPAIASPVSPHYSAVFVLYGIGFGVLVVNVGLLVFQRQEIK
ncbi:ABC transporter permease [Alicyclobacillus sp. SO9]|uniref:ABC transporter permease n=1 Tax=Alicyclobacillus sp. SO9 TaxID=2665646 RepID=UPI0018E7E7EC|nr:ABC transporter permease [Alicyclobacillus sp. SO9]QQE80078.1 ABC transporter permease [Alicyclobacillus sp. SO9]